MIEYSPANDLVLFHTTRPTRDGDRQVIWGPAKGMLIINMWVGRLEIIPVAVLLGSVLQRFNLMQ